MATILGPARKLVHDATAALLENDIPGKLASSVNGFVTSGFGIVGDVLGIVRDITRPDEAPPALVPPNPLKGG